MDIQEQVRDTGAVVRGTDWYIFLYDISTRIYLHYIYCTVDSALIHIYAGIKKSIFLRVLEGLLLGT